MAASVPALTDEAVRESLRQVLASPEFSGEPRRDPFLALIDLIRRWSGQFSEWSGDHPALAWLVVILLLVLLAGIVAHLVYVIVSGDMPWRSAQPARSIALEPWQVLEGAAGSWSEALRRAWDALAQGDTRRALWIAHRVLLGLLDAQGALRFGAGKTNAQYLRECVPGHPGSSPLQRLTAAYDRVIYGRARVDPALIAPLLAEVESVEKTAGTR